LLPSARAEANEGKSIHLLRTTPALLAGLVVALLMTVAPAPVRAQDTAADAEAREALRRARLYFDRGEFDRAVDAFAGILDTPVKLKTADDLHEGFLYYAFTLFLQGKGERAGEKLRFALRIKPDHAPSPVTTRPDLLAFYAQQQAAYLAENNAPELLEGIFPELRDNPGVGQVVRQQRFVPLFGQGLRVLGHRRAGAFFLVTETSSLAINVASIIMRLAVYNDRTPDGWTVTRVGRNLNYPSFAVFWAAIVVDFVVSVALQRLYRKHPERMPESARPIRGRPPPPPDVRVTPAGFTLTFW
jgi:tetratricopeptide (TPR) repeat protein